MNLKFVKFGIIEENNKKMWGFTFDGAI